ncbi:MAG TPA: hypothetical protein VFC19_05795 [Candidatus Limnocylindrales bacterium]|nr:hypothetical protein [Candidatus Limnocylindrales bacterium]
MTSFRSGEAARLLEVGTDTVHRWIDAGRPAARISPRSYDRWPANPAGPARLFRVMSR